MINNKVSSSSTSITQSIPSKATTSATPNTNTPINSTVGFEKGQVVRGEILDVKYNEVGIKLEDGRILTGKLEDAINLSIGDKVTFQVEDASLKNLAFKIVSESHSINIQSTIDKALEAAGLGKTILNQSIVKELLNQQMPVDKKTISLLIQQSLSNKTIPLSTLVLMNALTIPVTKENMRLFESFIHKNYNIMKDIRNLAEQIPELFSLDTREGNEANLFQNKALLNLVLKEPGLTMSNNIDIIKIDIIDQDVLKHNDMITDSQITNEILKSASKIEFEQNLSSKGMNTYIESLENKNSVGTMEFKNSYNQNAIEENVTKNTNVPILTGNILSQAESASLVNFIKGTPELKVLFTEEQITALNNGTAKVREIGFQLNQSIEASNYNTSFMHRLLEQVPSASSILSEYQNIQYQDNSIKTFLPQDNRINLIHLLDNFSLPKELKEQIQSGSISSKDLLTWIGNNLESSSDTKDFVLSKEFKDLIKEALLDKWAFTPQSLKETDIDKYFQNLTTQIKELKEYIEQAQNGSPENVIKQANNLQENISFLKTINDIFTYIPLPLKLQNQNTHGELYVYTKKKSGRTAADGISVLLHLAMDALGPIDIHINLKGNNIISKFYFDDSKIVEFIKTNIEQLENVLENKGYSINTEILIREKEINIVEQFINQNSATSTISRYNFDVRA